MDKDDQTVHYGDYISLYSESDLGYIASDSSSDLSNEPFVYFHQSYNLPEAVSSMTTMLFEVHVVQRYKMNKRYRKLLESDENKQELIVNVDKVRKLKESVMLENHDNEQVMRRNLGRRLRFGDVIQLRHALSGNFIHINSNKLSEIQKSAFKTILLPYGAKTAQFQVVPKYKVDMDDADVVIGSYISLESIASRSYYFHTNPYPLYPSSKQRPGLSELNISLEKQGFIIYNSKTSKLSTKSYLCGLDIVHFFHQETESYIASEGYFGGPPSEQLHSRIRKVDLLDVRSLTPSTNCNTYWEIEKAQCPFSSDPVAWLDQMRLRHGSTKLYLSMNKKKQLLFTDNIHDNNTIFVFRPVNKDRDLCIRKGINVRIKHLQTSTWMVISNRHFYEKQEYKRLGKYSGVVEWDDAKFCVVKMGKISQYGDAFNIEEVPPGYKIAYHKLCGFVPMVYNLKAKIQNSVTLSDESWINYFTKSLSEVIHFLCSGGSKPIKTKQKLMRSTKMIDTLFSIVEVYGKLSMQTQEKWRRPFKVLFELISKYIGGNKKNTEYVGRYFSLFTSPSWKTSPLVTEIVAVLTLMVSSSAGLAEQIQKIHLQSVLELIRHKPHPVFFRFLSQTCSSKDVPIIENQDFIIQDWLIKEKTGLYLIKSGEEVGLEENEYYVSTDQGLNWVSIKDFFDPNYRNYTSGKCDFLLEQLEFFKALTLGRNLKGIEVITKKECYVTWPMVLSCLQNRNLSDEFRARLCKLIPSLFLTYGPKFTALEYPNLLYSFNEINACEKRKLSSESTNELDECILQLHDWILRFTIQNASMCVDDIARNELIVQVFNLLRNLIEFGYFGDTNMLIMMVDPLLNILDGRNDMKFRISKNCLTRPERDIIRYFKLKGRFEVSDSNRVLVEAKNAGLEVLELILMFLLNFRIDNLIKLYKLSRENAGDTKTENPNSFYQHLLKKEMDVAKIKKYSHDYKSFMNSMDDVMYSQKYFDVDMLRSVMLDLAQYKYDSLLHKSLLFLTKFFSSELSVFNSSQHVMISLTTETDTWIEMLQNYAPRLKIIINEEWTSKALAEFTDILIIIKAHCFLPNTDTPNVLFKKILYSSNICNILLMVFDKHTGLVANTSERKNAMAFRRISSIRPENQNKVYDMYRETFDCLMAMAQEMCGIQNILFDKMQYIMMVNNQTVVRKLKLMKVVFADREDLVENVSSQIIEILFDWLLKFNEFRMEIVEVLLCLGRIMHSGRIIRENMTIIMKLMMKNWSKFGFLSQSTKDEKLELINSTEVNAEKGFFLRTIYLMALGVGLELEYIESFCQSILSLEDCFYLISNTDDFLAQMSLFRFSAHVYLQVESKQGHQYFVTDMLFWKVIEKVRDTSLTWLEKIEKLTNQEVHDIMKSLKDIGTVNSAETSFIAWVMDGTLIFFREMLQSRAGHKDNLTDSQTLLDATRCLLHIVKFLGPQIVNLEQMQVITKFLFSAVLGNYLRYSNIESVIDNLGRITCTESSTQFSVSHQDMILSHYEETVLNQKFRIFLDNCRQLYLGENCVSTQIIYPSPYIEKITEKTKYINLNNVEELPLGAEFQQLVITFLKLDEDEPEKRFSNLRSIIRHLKMPMPRQMNSSVPSIRKQVRDRDFLNTYCFRILRTVIYNEIRRLPSDWPLKMNNKKVVQQLQFIRDIQKALCDMQLIESVLQHSSRTTSPVTMELFAFLKFLLFNSSTYVQENMFQFFVCSITETFFFAIKEYTTLFEIDIKALRRKTNTIIQSKQREEKQFIVRRQTLTKMNLSNYTECKEYFERKINEKVKIFDNIANFKFDNMITNGFGILLMEVLQSLCEGQFVQLQDYLREQIDNPKSFNLVFQTCSMIGNLYAHISGITIGILTQIFGALNQMTIGNQENRITLVNGKVIDYINYILRVKEFADCKPENVLQLRQVIATLLITLTEENTGAAINLSKEIMITVDKKAILDIILLYNQLSKKDVIPNLDRIVTQVSRKEKPTGVLARIKHTAEKLAIMKAVKLRKMAPIKEQIFEAGYTYTSIILRFIDLDPQFFQTLSDEECTPEHRNAFRSFKKVGRAIEIVKDDTLQRVHFRIRDPKCIREDMIEDIKWGVDRSSSASKLRDFIAWSWVVINDLKKAGKPNPIKSFLINYWYILNYMPVLLSLIISIMILITFISPYSLEDGDFDRAKLNNPFPDISTNPDLSTPLIYIATIHTIFSIILLVSYFLVSKPGFSNVRELRDKIRNLFHRIPSKDHILPIYNNRTKIAREKLTMISEEEQTDAVIDYQKLIDTDDIDQKRFLEENEGDDGEPVDELGSNHMGDNKSKKNSATTDGKTDPVASEQEYNVFSLATLYYFTFTLISLIGTIFGAYLSQWYGDHHKIAYFVFAFHLVNIAIIVPDLKGVFTAIKKSLPSMAWVGFLILVLVYLFNIILFQFFRDSMSMGENLYCDTLGHCYLTLIRYGIIFDKWQEIFVPHFDSKKNFNDYLYLAIFTVCLYVIIGIIMLNIIAGIIVDKFAITRNLKGSKVDDMNSTCFICGRSSYEFETMAKGFRYHIMHEHNMWAYLYFLLELQTKRIADFSALQWYVHKLFQRRSLSFFPIGRAAALTQAEEVTEEHKLVEANEQLDKLLEKLKDEKLLKTQKKKYGKYQTDAKISNVGTSPDIIVPSQNAATPTDGMGPVSRQLSAEGVEFTPSTNISNIPINMISFNRKEDQ